MAALPRSKAILIHRHVVATASPSGKQVASAAAFEAYVTLDKTTLGEVCQQGSLLHEQREQLCSTS